jgi:LysM repeat protein
MSIKKVILFIAIICFSSIASFAQENTKSEEIKWINGEKFYIHTVSQGQGLYAIKRLYKVEEKDILENNPEAFDGLKPGQKLKIPFIKQEEGPAKYKIHVIEAGQTIYSISKIHNVSQESILELNPETKNGYKVNQKIKIPLEQKEVKPIVKDDEPKGRTYKVKRKDTLYGLSKKFNISQESILELNPIIVKEGLKKGQRIRIPGRELIVKEALYVPIDTMYYDDDSMLDKVIICDSVKLHRYTPMDIALMLPFELDIQAMEREEEKMSSKKPKYASKPFLEFYQAFLLSINELKEDGYQFNIHVFNTKKDENEVKAFLKRPVFNDMDLIVGPVYKKNFALVQAFADSLRIPLINPIKKMASASSSSKYTINIFPDATAVTLKTIQLLMANDTSDIYIVHSGQIQDLDYVENFHKLYKQELQCLGRDTTPNFKELIFPDSKKIDFKPSLNKEKSSLVIVLSENQAFVSNVFTRLNILTDDYQIQMIGRPKWKKFDNIDVSYLHNLNYLQLTNEYVDYTNPSVKRFVEKYRALYNIEPSKYAFYAYDLSYNFAQYFYWWEDLDCIKDFKLEGLMLGFYMQKMGCCWVNENLFVLQYDKEFNVKEVQF